VAALSGGLLASKPAAAEVTIAKGDTWEAYVAGRAGAFVSYAFGQGYPVPARPDSMIQPGAGADPPLPRARDTIFEYDAAGMPLPTQGKIRRMRVRSGYFPNIFTLGSRKTFGPQLKLTAQVSVWGTIEGDDVISAGGSEGTPANGNRDNGVSADVREGFMKLEGDWGQVQGGRFISFVGRGSTEMDVLYAHGYGAGFPMTTRDITFPVTGEFSFPGPTTGMTGFGVLGAMYAPGIAYTTPSLGGVRVAVGAFEAAKYTSARWSLTDVIRPEAAITYELAKGGVKAHLFTEGAFQKLHEGNGTQSTSIWGLTYGGRLEVGPIRVGGSGFLGRGIGLNHAFDDNESLSSPLTMRAAGDVMLPSYKIRNQRGFVGILQLVLGPVDLHAAVGQTVMLLLPEDKAGAATLSVIKSQTGISTGVVYHLNESFHLDLDFINGAYRWYGGEKQSVNVLNGGVTVTF
jgi:hypothetical protein